MQEDMRLQEVNFSRRTLRVTFRLISLEGTLSKKHTHHLSLQRGQSFHIHHVYIIFSSVLLTDCLTQSVYRPLKRSYFHYSDFQNRQHSKPSLIASGDMSWLSFQSKGSMYGIEPDQHIYVFRMAERMPICSLRSFSELLCSVLCPSVHHS